MSRLIIVSCLLASCFAPGRRLSSRNRELFAAPPVILHHGGEYSIAWTYGTYKFYFQPEYSPRNGRLVFSLESTTSTGLASGKRTEIPIKGAENVAALQHGGAVWWEPDRALSVMAIIESPQ